MRGIEKVLDMTQMETGSMRAQKVISIGHSTHNGSLEQSENDMESDALDLVSKHRWSTSNYRRGFGSAEHSELRGDTYAVWASEVFIELCRAR